MSYPKSLCMYKYKLVSDLEDALTCPICRDVAEDPWQHNLCGRLFCNSCFNQLEKGMPCPFCKRDNPQYFHDGKSTREIRSLHVECDKVETGCQWKGTVSTLAEHLTTCGFVSVPCPNKCEKTKEKFSLFCTSEVNSFLRKNLDGHLTKDCPNRPYKCKYCNTKGTYASITQVHDEICVKKILRCTNRDCTKTMQRQHLATHVQFECEHTVIACKHQSIGCAKKMKKKDMAAHEQDDTLHLHMAINTVTYLTAQCNLLNYTISNDSMTIKVTEYRKRASELLNYLSPSFYTGFRGYHIKIQVHIGQLGDVIVQALFLEGQYDDELKWPFSDTLNLTLLNQAKDQDHYKKETNCKNYFKDIRPGSSVLLGTLSPTQLTRQPYVQNDSLYFRVSVQLADTKQWLKHAI